MKIRSLARLGGSAALAAACLLCVPTAAGGAPGDILVYVETANDDLRAGSTASFVMRMRDGREQAIPLSASGEVWPNGSRKSFPVGPRSPYDWTQVSEAGIRFRPDPGSGLRQSDDWAMSFHFGSSSCGAPGSTPPGTFCVDLARGGTRFEGDRGVQTSFAAVAVAGGCASDLECDRDGLFCNDRRLACRPSASAPRAKVCVDTKTTLPACPGQACDEAADRCACLHPEDEDGDGRTSRACGGDDCDDRNASRFPGNAEVCDALGADEDCDFSTIGDRDVDGDGFVDAACWNDVRAR